MLVYLILVDLNPVIKRFYEKKTTDNGKTAPKSRSESRFVPVVAKIIATLVFSGSTTKGLSYHAKCCDKNRAESWSGGVPPAQPA